MTRTVTAKAPGKLIISGEHSAVHGKPALAMAINRHIHTTIIAHSSPDIIFDLLHLPHKGRRTLSAVHKAKTRLQESFHRFQKGELPIKEVLKKPFELLEYTTSQITSKLGTEHGKGFHVRTDSDLPTGSGLGSSAASIVSTTEALAHYLGRQLSQEEARRLHLNAENMQHGQSSGIDIFLSYQGGVHYFIGDQTVGRNIWPAPLWLIETGKPESTTGECVSHTSEQFNQHPQWLQQLAAITEKIDQAWQQEDIAGLQQGIRDNHRQLVKLGVVPEPVAQLIAELEAEGMAAKISGAGSIKGPNAGAVLVVGHIDNPERFHMQPIQIATQGVEVSYD